MADTKLPEKRSPSISKSPLLKKTKNTISEKLPEINSARSQSIGRSQYFSYLRNFF